MKKSIENLQNSAEKQSVDISELLRKALVIATKLGMNEEKWLRQELEGYMPNQEDQEYDEIPEYRSIVGKLEALNPRLGWRPVLFEDPNIENEVSKRKLWESVAGLQSLINNADSSKTMALTFPNQVNAFLSRKAETSHTEFRVKFHTDQVSTILERLRVEILMWSLQLDDLGFSEENASSPSESESQSNNGNITIEGSVIGSQIQGFSSSSIQNMSENRINAGHLSYVIDEVEKYKSEVDFSEEQRDLFEKYLEELKEETSKDELDDKEVSRLSKLMTQIVVGTSSGVASKGILELLGTIQFPG